jgi:hypothetical protein
LSDEIDEIKAELAAAMRECDEQGYAKLPFQIDADSTLLVTTDPEKPGGYLLLRVPRVTVGLYDRVPLTIRR